MPLRERLGRVIGSLETWFQTDNAAPPSPAPKKEGSSSAGGLSGAASPPYPAPSRSGQAPRLGQASAQLSSASRPTGILAAIGAKKTESDNWSNLKSFLQMLDRSPIAFGPLKVVTEGLVACIGIYEKAANNKKEYENLRSELDILFGELQQHLEQHGTRVVTASMESLCRSIQDELDYVQGKQGRGAVKRHIEARDDSDDVLLCYQHIQLSLKRVLLNVNLSIWNIVDEQATDARLDRLCSSMSACYNSSQAMELKRGACTEGTRVEVLVQMHRWIYKPMVGSVYWLNGMAGTGKTTIAYTLCAELDSSYQLGASFFCSRSLPECRDVNLIIPSIAYQLAQFSRPFRSALSRVLERERNAHTRLLQIQFESLIVQPLLAVRDTLPQDLVVVIDALDECNNQQSTGLILDVLFTNTPELPIKFFVSSRPEPEIREQMRKQGKYRSSSRLVLHELDKGVVQEDIETYLRQALAPAHPTEAQLRILVQRAGILFIYAATVVRYIGSKSFRQNPRARLQTILNTSTVGGDNPYKDIDELYTVILKAAIDDPDLNEVEREDMKQVLYTVICAREPLTISGLSGLLGLNDIDRVNVALQPLWSVLHVAEPSGLVTTLHASFPDYMFDSKRSGQYHCNSTIHDNILARCCFDCIETVQPRFNISRLESSYVLDDQIPKLNARVNKAISSELFYACRYWAAHLERTGASIEIVERLRDLFSTRLLLWMEVLNLKKCMHNGVGSIQQAEDWCVNQNCSDREELMQLMHDAWRFVATFTSSPVSQSTAHIYTSMLPFWPESSPVGKHYAKSMRMPVVPQGPAIARRRLELLSTWPLDEEVSGLAWSPNGVQIALATGGKIFILHGLTGRVMKGPLNQELHSVWSIGYSGDGNRIVSGSQDGTIRVWDTESGKMMLGPLRGHSDGVTSVSFSPDSTRIASGSRDTTIYLWNAQSGRRLLGPLKGHTNWVTSLAFSPDGVRIVSGSRDQTMHLWDVRSKAVLGPIKGHTHSVTSVAFSPDGTRVASGSNDKTIRVWDIQNGQMVLEPLEGHTDSVTSVAFSPNATHIVSGSGDKTIRVWDIQSGQTVLGPLRGHTDSVILVALSPDGTRIVSGSLDRTLRVWDIRSGQTVLDPLEGHTDPVTSVAFSPNGACIVSGSDDKTIRVWNIQNGQTLLDPLKGHTHPVTSVEFSPDGTRIVSGSGDSTVRLWDVQSGQTVLGPLRGHTDSVRSVTFSPDGTRIVSGSRDQTIRVWDTRSGQTMLGPLEGHTNSITSVTVSPDGAYIASSSLDSTIRVWDMRSGQMIFSPLTGHTMSVASVAFSFDSTQIVSGSADKTIRIWDVRSGRMAKGPLEGHTDDVRSVGFSPNGTCVVSGSDDKTIRVWDVRSGQTVVGPLKGHTNWVRSVVFSPDGTRVASGSHDNTACVWDIESDKAPMNRLSPTLPTPVLWKMGANGWVTGDQSGSLVWVPPDLRDVLLNPRIIFSTSPNHVRLNFDDVRIGESWIECYQPV